MEKQAAAKREGAQKAHSIFLENRQKAALTGVSEVVAFNDNQVILGTDHRDITLTGSDLHVTRLMLDEGQLTVEGRIDGILYSQKPARRWWMRKRNP